MIKNDHLPEGGWSRTRSASADVPFVRPGLVFCAARSGALGLALGEIE